MTYRLELSPNVLSQLANLPHEVAIALADAMADVIDAPHDPTISDPTATPGERTTVFGEVGLVTYLVHDDLLIVVALDLIWGG
ncbi:hypothetical protein ACFQ07_31920 [Actinomadura adrarensis]|uniref:Type II toxin-antitoxin system RelE/ParE family toxin n=1 Tax=Actinomadura adrarensis TaxID=1819600 RepID=A0ABW3CSA0_9ACTN